MWLAGPGPGPAPKTVSEVVAPLQLHTGDTILSFLSTVFGTPQEITLSELALETFFPADPQTAEILRGTGQMKP